MSSLEKNFPPARLASSSSTRGNMGNRTEMSEYVATIKLQACMVDSYLVQALWVPKIGLGKLFPSSLAQAQLSLLILRELKNLGGGFLVNNVFISILWRHPSSSAIARVDRSAVADHAWKDGHVIEWNKV